MMVEKEDRNQWNSRDKLDSEVEHWPVFSPSFLPNMQTIIHPTEFRSNAISSMKASPRFPQLALSPPSWALPALSPPAHLCHILPHSVL